LEQQYGDFWTVFLYACGIFLFLLNKKDSLVHVGEI